MSLLLKQQAPFLCLLCALKPKERNHLINKSNESLISCIIECALNVLKGNIRITKKEKKQLSKYKTILRNIVKEKKSILKCKKLIKQKGTAFLPSLLLPIVTSLI